MFAMTAHAIYTAYDSVSTANHSRKIIEKVIRRHIGFKGILISDDISMKALRFGLKNNAKKALNAGCNLVIHLANSQSSIIPLHSDVWAGNSP